jgi:hypothetical protein
MPPDHHRPGARGDALARRMGRGKLLAALLSDLPWMVRRHQHGGWARVRAGLREVHAIDQPAVRAQRPESKLGPRHRQRDEVVNRLVHDRRRRRGRARGLVVELGAPAASDDVRRPLDRSEALVRVIMAVQDEIDAALLEQWQPHDIDCRCAPVTAARVGRLVEDGDLLSRGRLGERVLQEPQLVGVRGVIRVQDDELDWSDAARIPSCRHAH